MHTSSLTAAQTPVQPPAVSEEYTSLILRSQYRPFRYDERYFEQVVNSQYSILYIPISDNLYAVNQIGYSGVPNLFTFISTTSLERSGILMVQTQPFLNLKGSGVLVGFLDSGIDYTHPAFRKPDGTTRILGIWDQTDQSGRPPEGLSYGTEYTEAQINEALRSPDPLGIVPERDDDGHGTAAAGIACGTPDPGQDFTGAAPESSLLFVRLKPAKQYLLDYLLIPQGAAAFQEDDLMLGVRYLMDTALRLQMPLVICITLGTNQGGHTGNTPLEEVLTAALSLAGTYVVAGTGNEVGMAHHFYGKLNAANESLDAELLVGEGTGGFTVEFWSDPLEFYSIGFVSPFGETIQPQYDGLISYRRFTFPLENTTIYVYYSTLEMQSGRQVAMIRFLDPTPGLWRLRIVNRSFVNGGFHLWLPITGLAPEGLSFVSPNPDTTLVTPSCAEPLISVSNYDAYNNTLYLRSGRGYTANGILKPDFASPGVSLTAPRPDGSYSYGSFTGSSAASALAAGSAALLAQWGMRYYPDRLLSAVELKTLFLRGAARTNTNVYPNREWGYGTMNVYGVLQNLTR